MKRSIYFLFFLLLLSTALPARKPVFDLGEYIYNCLLPERQGPLPQEVIRTNKVRHMKKSGVHPYKTLIRTYDYDSLGRCTGMYGNVIEIGEWKSKATYDDTLATRGITRISKYVFDKYTIYEFDPHTWTTLTIQYDANGRPLSFSIYTTGDTNSIHDSYEFYSVRYSNSGGSCFATITDPYHSVIQLKYNNRQNKLYVEKGNGKNEWQEIGKYTLPQQEKNDKRLYCSAHALERMTDRFKFCSLIPMQGPPVPGRDVLLVTLDAQGRVKRASTTPEEDNHEGYSFEYTYDAKGLIRKEAFEERYDPGDKIMITKVNYSFTYL